MVEWNGQRGHALAFLEPRSGQSCAYCRGELKSETAPFCKQCGHSIHLDCWEGFGGCATPFCLASPGFEHTLNNSTAKTNYAAAFPSATRFCPNCGGERVGIYCGACGTDFIELDINQKLNPGGRDLAELVSEKHLNNKDSIDSILRGPKYKKAKHCINCGTDLAGEAQCAGCLYEN